MPNDILTDRAEFKALARHYEEVRTQHMRDLFAADAARFEKFHLQHEGILLDYSMHRITEKTPELLIALAESCDVEGWRDKMFAGFPVNTAENRAALHVALRGSADKGIEIDGEDVEKFVGDTLNRIKIFSNKIRKDKKITDVVNIGIGGSDLGVRLVCNALLPFADGPAVHFVENMDAAVLAQLLKKLKPENTLFIAVSKSFTTLETLENARVAKTWLGPSLATDHFAAATENIEKANAFGISEDRIFPMRKWIGGRLGIWGAAGLAAAIGVGFENFKKFLDGAHAMDKHFQSAPLHENMPVIMAMMGIWYRNFFGFPALAVTPYAQNLQALPTWLQQVDMESNGKSVSREGKPLKYATAPIIFGEPGTNAQHAFFQALHQGTDVIPCDFIIVRTPEKGFEKNHTTLNANALAQAKALMEGSIHTEPQRSHPGNRPSSTIVIDRLDPFHLGMLMALYEHKVFVQGVVWGINSFDQWGVELGKILSLDIAQAIENKVKNGIFDSSTDGLMRHLKGGGGG